MGIYDRDWYRQSPRRLAGWYSELDTVGKVILFVFVGSLIALLVMAFRHSHRADFPDPQAVGGEEEEVVGDRGIHAAIEDGNYRRVVQILQGDPAQVQAVRGPGRADQPLHHAAAKGNQRIVTLLLRHGAAVDAPGDGGATALHRAAEHGNVRAAKVLLERDADLEAKDDRGLTPLCAAVRLDDPALARLLLEEGARVTPAALDAARKSPASGVMLDLLRRYQHPR